MENRVETIASSIVWGVAFILVGVLWLLDSLEVIQFDIGQWWPMIFVVIGINIVVSGIAKAISNK